MTQDSIKALAEKYVADLTKDWPAYMTASPQTIINSFIRGASLVVEENKLVAALNKIIEMNRQQSVDQYGDADRAESWSCVKVARTALASLELKPHASEGDEIERLNLVIELKESERKEWAELCIRKQAVIDSVNMEIFGVHENLILGNGKEANEIVLSIIEIINNKKICPQ